ncbi:MAG TPA: PAS domain-containing protein [Thiobacillus sp.]|nr:PAS domain-containing protein [Thiobacillus sp.]HQT69441.1 PAS domain-containing protein [Thiobacillus sp.]
MVFTRITPDRTAAGSDFSQFAGSTRWQALIHQDEIKAVQHVIAQLFSGEAAVVQHENSWRRPDGSPRLLNWTHTVLKDAAGRIQYVIGTGIDITDPHHAENRVREILQDASRLQRMQTVNELATLLAHELDQPLAAIASSSSSYAEAGQQLLGRMPLKQDKLTRNLEQISQQALRAGDVIKHLRSFVGRWRIDPVPLDLNKVVRNTCSLMLPKARSRGIHLVLELADPLPPAMGVECISARCCST